MSIKYKLRIGEIHPFISVHVVKILFTLSKLREQRTKQVRGAAPTFCLTQNVVGLYTWKNLSQCSWVPPSGAQTISSPKFGTPPHGAKRCGIITPKPVSLR